MMKLNYKIQLWITSFSENGKYIEQHNMAYRIFNKWIFKKAS